MRRLLLSVDPRENAQQAHAELRNQGGITNGSKRYGKGVRSMGENRLKET